MRRGRRRHLPTSLAAAIGDPHRQQLRVLGSPRPGIRIDQLRDLVMCRRRPLPAAAHTHAGAQLFTSPPQPAAATPSTRSGRGNSGSSSTMSTNSSRCRISMVTSDYERPPIAVIDSHSSTHRAPVLIHPPPRAGGPTHPPTPPTPLTSAETAPGVRVLRRNFPPLPPYLPSFRRIPLARHPPADQRPDLSARGAPPTTPATSWIGPSGAPRSCLG